MMINSKRGQVHPSLFNFLAPAQKRDPSPAIVAAGRSLAIAEEALVPSPGRGRGAGVEGGREAQRLR